MSEWRIYLGEDYLGILFYHSLKKMVVHQMLWEMLIGLGIFKNILSNYAPDTFLYLSVYHLFG